MRPRRRGQEPTPQGETPDGRGGWYVNPELAALKKAHKELEAEKAALEEKYQQLVKQVKQRAEDEALLPEPLRAEAEYRIATAKRIHELSTTIEQKEKDNAARVIQKAWLKKRPETQATLTSTAEAFKLVQAKLNSEEEKSSLRAQADPALCQVGRVLHYDKLLRETGKELARFKEERAQLQKELKIQTPATQRLLTFGGSRCLRYQMDAKEKAIMDRDFLRAVTSLDFTKAQDLYDRGANVNMVDPETGLGLLLTAVFNIKSIQVEDSTKMAKWLITLGANPNQRTVKDVIRDHLYLVLHKGSTPLMALAYKWQMIGPFSEVADLLIEKGALIDAQNDSDITALHLATEFDDNKVSIDYLVNKDARGDIRNKENNTALQHYQKKNLHHDAEIVQLLQKAPSLKV